MRFEEALKCLRDGKKVRKRKIAYYDSNVVFYIVENKMFHDNIDTGAYNVKTDSLNSDSIVNSDWEIVDDDILAVLEPVPSYIEFQELESDSLAKDEGAEIVSELKEENKRLKEALYKKQEESVNQCLMCDKIDFHKRISELEGKLQVAIETLKHYSDYELADKALKQIEGE